VESGSLAGGALWILPPYLAAHVITSVPGCSPSTAARRRTPLAAWASGLGLPESIPNGAPTCSSPHRLPTGIWWTALYPAGECLCCTGLSFLGEGLEPGSGGDGARRLMFSTAEQVLLSPCVQPCVLICRFASSIFGKTLALMIKPLQSDQNVSCLMKLLPKLTPCLPASSKPQQE